MRWFELGKGSKIPAIKGWSNPVNCNDSDVLSPPDTGCYGLLTGYEWVILDLDVRAAKGGKPPKDGVAVIREFLTAKGIPWPKTWTVRTPSGGLHLYFTADPARSMRKKTPLLPGVDFLALGSYAKAGDGYEVTQEYGEYDAAPIPEWLYELVEARSSASKSDAPATAATPIPETDPRRPERIGRATTFLLETPPCIEGQGGDERLWEVCLRLTRSYELDDDTLMALIGLHFNKRCAPPWPEDTIRRKLSEAREKGKGPCGTFSAVGPLFAPSATADNDGDDCGFAEAHGFVTPHEKTYKFSPAEATCNGEQTAIKATDVNAIFMGQSANPDFAGVFCFDEMRQTIVARNPPMRLGAERGGISKVDLIAVQHWLGYHGYKAPIPLIDNAIELAAAGNRVHPIREYLAALPAPTTSHLKTIGATLFGDDAPNASDFVRKWMIGCVSRVMDPGCQFDTALTLVGTAGGERKSSFFNVMAGDDFYRSSLARIGDQQAVGMNMRGMWLVELGELSSLRTTDRDSFAEFITRRREQFNAKYERCEAREPRQCGICATTNTEQFLDAFDPAVRRRFWPVYVGKRIDIRWVQEHRDEMWAEAYAAFKAGEPWWYEDEAVLEESKERFVAASPTEEKLLEFLQNDSQRASIEGKNATSIAQIALGLQGTVSASIRQQVAHILNKYAGEYDITRQRKRGLTTYLFGSKK